MTAAAFPPESLVPFLERLASRYRVERELGRGGMATVYYAEDLQEHRPVAIKVLLPELAASIGADRFLREIEVGGVLKEHPNIVGVLDSGSAEGRLYYVMPFVEGAALRDRLDAQKQLGIDESVDIVRQVADALDFAHSKGIIHRDIKPENILLSGKTALLADFGIARAVSVAGGEKLTQTGMAIGTPTYMSPEQAMGSKDVTPESDIYSLACVLYEMLAGQPPFTGPTAMALLARHSLDQVPSLKIVRGTIPDAVEDAIAKAMAKVPADRFHSAKEFAAALTDHEGAARKRAIAQAASLQASAHLTGQMPTPAYVPAQKSGGKGKLIGAIAAVAVLAIGGFAAYKMTGGSGGGGATKAGGPAASEIAVLYLEDRSSDKSLGYLADGLTESLIHELGAVKGLHVISRNGVAPFKGQTVSTDSVSKALNVGTIVSGTVRATKDSLRVDVSAVDARNGTDIGSTKIVRAKEESFELQDDLAREVAVFIRKQVGKLEGEVQGKAGTRNAQAYEAYQRARQMMADAEQLLSTGNSQSASAQLYRADTAFQRVEALDKNWFAPIVQQGWIAFRQSRMLDVFDGATSAKFIDDGLAHAERAVQMAPNNADALELRGSLRYWQWISNIIPEGTTSTKLLADAETDLTASTNANPAQASAWNALSHLRMAKSKTSEAKLAALKAYETDPYLTDANRTLWRLVQASNDLGNEAEARKYCELGAKRFPEDFRFTECKLWLLSLKTPTKPSAAAIWSAYDAFVKASPPDAVEFHKKKGGMIAAIALLRAGLPDSARNVATRSRAGTDVDPGQELVFFESIVRAQAGDKDDAFRLLNKFLAANPQLRETAAEDESWWFEDLYSDPRWEQLKRGG